MMGNSQTYKRRLCMAMLSLTTMGMALNCATYDPEGKTKQAGRPQQQYSAVGIPGMAFDQEASCQVALFRETQGKKQNYRLASAAHCYQRWIDDFGSSAQTHTIKVIMEHGFADLPREMELQVLLLEIGDRKAVGSADEDLVIFAVQGLKFASAAVVELPEKYQKIFALAAMPQLVEDEFGDLAIESGRSLLLVYYRDGSQGLRSLVAESPDVSGHNNASVLFPNKAGMSHVLGHTFLSSPSVSGAGIYSCQKQLADFADCKLICIHSGTSRFMENSCTALIPIAKEGI